MAKKTGGDRIAAYDQHGQLIGLVNVDDLETLADPPGTEKESVAPAVPTVTDLKPAPADSVGVPTDAAMAKAADIGVRKAQRRGAVRDRFEASLLKSTLVEITKAQRQVAAETLSPAGFEITKLRLQTGLAEDIRQHRTPKTSR